ncbi:MAG: MBOAT family protein, partial [Bacteroidales bacterium]|nr:MBOAT family protein [Bacteroidales bacterium]
MEYINSIFSYDPSSPMIFTRFFFWGFFAVVLLGYSLISNKITLRSIYLLVLSLFFYYKSSGFFFFLIVFSTLVDFYIGKWLYNSQKENVRRVLLGLSVFINLLLLSYFKYTFFFTEAINDMFGTSFVAKDYLSEFTNLLTGSHFDTSKIFLPVGISFFTFQTMSYTLDIFN